MTFEEVYEEFKIYAKSRHKKQGFETLSRNFNLHILPYFKGRKIDDLNKQDVLAWQEQIYDHNFSNSFNNSLYCEFSSFIQYCILKDYVKFNFVREVGNFKKRIEVKKYDVYNIWEFRKFRRNLENFIYKLYFSVLFFCGLRPSEALALRFSDFFGRYIHIIHNLERRGKRALDTPKNASSIRYVKVNLFLYIQLTLLKRYYVKKYGSDFDYYVFGGIKPLSTTTIDRYKLKACEKAHLRVITQHQFRHSYATRLLHLGIPIDYISYSMGHSRVSTTLDVYVHKEKRMRRTLLSRLFL